MRAEQQVRLGSLRVDPMTHPRPALLTSLLLFVFSFIANRIRLISNFLHIIELMITLSDHCAPICRSQKLIE